MNIITNILYSIYLYFLLKIDDFSLYLIIWGIIFLYLENFIIFFVKNKIKYNNKLLHSIPILIFMNILISIFFVFYLKKSFFISFSFLTLGNFIHLFSDLIKSKKLYLFYPFNNKTFNISISNYFDIVPSIILIISNFLIILFGNKINLLEKSIPFLILILYFITRFIIKRIILKIILKDLDNSYKVFINPTLKLNIWNVIRVADNNIYLFNLDIIKRKYLFVKYFSNNMQKGDLKIIDKNKLFKSFRNSYNYLYFQSYDLKKGYRILQVFDVKNFFNLFKREQVYYEAKIKNNKLVKEKVIL